MASEKQSKTQKFAPLVATLLLLLSGSLAYYLPSERQIETRTTLTVATNSLGSWFFGLALLCWIACIVCSCISLVGKNKWGFLSFLAVLVYPLIYFSTGLEEAANAYIDEGKLSDSDGSEYHLFSNSFIQGNKLLIAKFNDRKGSRTNYSKLATASWSADADHLQLIRSQSKPSTLPLTITRDRLLIGTIERKYTYVAFDLKRQVNFPISKVSPFVLLSAQDTPNQTDFEEALKGDLFSVSDPDVLKSELKNPNQIVREMAQKLLTKSSSKAGLNP